MHEIFTLFHVLAIQKSADPVSMPVNAPKRLIYLRNVTYFKRMSLSDLIAEIESKRASLAAINVDKTSVASLRERFGDRNIEIQSASLDSVQGAVLVLSKDGEFQTAVDPGTVTRNRDRTDPEFEPETYEPILDELDETTFSSYTRQDMVAASKEIEDRAWRIGSGEVYAGFQRLGVLESERDAYERLASPDNLDVHAYATPDGTVISTSNLVIHAEDTAEIASTWFVAYDGDGRDHDKSLLLAEERETGFYGFWSYNPDTVDRAIAYLTQTYGRSGSESEGTARPQPGPDD